MANISGTFSNASPGRLTISLYGIFVAGTSRDAGFPSRGTGSTLPDVLLAPVVNGVHGPAINRDAPTTSFQMDYPGGNVSWSVSTTVIDHNQGGILTGVGFTNISMTLELIKK